MFTRNVSRLCLIPAALWLAATAAVAQTPDPNDVADRCIQRMRAIARHCGRAMNVVAEHATSRIDELQADGHDEAARRVARHTIGRIRAMAMACTRELHREAVACVRLLRHLGASDELIASVQEAARRATRHVRGAERHAIGVVLEALNN